MSPQENNTKVSVKFCVTGRSGLGHVRRICNIVERLRACNPDLIIILLTNAPLAGLSDTESALFDRIQVLAKNDMAAALAGMPPGPVVVDTAVIDRVGFLADPLCLVLRETVAARLPAFRLDGGRPWDAVIVPAPGNDWTVDPAFVGAAMVRNVGWIYRDRPAAAGRVLPLPTGRPRLLVATGGGGTTATAATLRDAIDILLARLRALVPDVEVLQVAGPRLPEQGRLALADRVIDVGSRLNEAFAEADAVVSTVGYNSILELAGVDTPSLLVPIERTFDDQRTRADRWGPALGLSHRDAAASAAWLAGVLASRIRREVVCLPASGAAEAAALIISLAKGRTAGLLRKPVERPHLAAARASSIFAAGLRTLPARPDGDCLAMVRIGGATLRSLVTPDGAPATTAGGLARACGAALRLALASLDTMPAAATGLSAFDPLGKVRPRLAPGSPAARAMGESLRQRAAALSLDLERRLAALAAPGIVLHGDFHVGQLLMPPDGGAPIIIDLDDLAIGRREADVANLVAHVVSSKAFYAGPPAQGFDAVLEAILDDGARLDREALRRHGAAALLRRALKLAERGDGAARAGELIEAAETLAWSDPPHVLASVGRPAETPIPRP